MLAPAPTAPASSGDRTVQSKLRRLQPAAEPALELEAQLGGRLELPGEGRARDGGDGGRREQLAEVRQPAHRGDAVVVGERDELAAGRAQPRRARVVEPAAVLAHVGGARRLDDLRASPASPGSLSTTMNSSGGGSRRRTASRSPGRYVERRCVQTMTVQVGRGHAGRALHAHAGAEALVLALVAGDSPPRLEQGAGEALRIAQAARAGGPEGGARPAAHGHDDAVDARRRPVDGRRRGRLEHDRAGHRRGGRRGGGQDPRAAELYGRARPPGIMRPAWTPKPRIAVIIPCHGEGRLIAEAVASIQEPEPVHIVVVDDHSPDEETRRTLDELEAGGVDRDPARAERAASGARACSGLAVTHIPYVAPLDADDLAEPGTLSTMADRLDDDPEAVACVGDILEFGGVGELVRAVPQTLDPFRVAYTNEYPVTALFRRYRARRGWRLVSRLDRRGRATRTGTCGWTSPSGDGGSCTSAPGVIGYRRRLHGSRLNAEAKRRHAEIYDAMRNDHGRAVRLARGAPPSLDALADPAAAVPDRLRRARRGPVRANAQTVARPVRDLDADTPAQPHLGCAPNSPRPSSLVPAWTTLSA